MGLNRTRQREIKLRPRNQKNVAEKHQGKLSKTWLFNHVYLGVDVCVKARVNLDNLSVKFINPMLWRCVSWCLVNAEFFSL